MHADLTLSAATLLSFALVLARITGVFAFIPMPIADAGPSSPRIAIALACTMALYPRWPALGSNDISLGTMALWMVAELALGTAIGLMVSFIAESLTVGAQMLALQAGYGYASVVDPTTQADSDVLAVLAQLTAGLLFFTTGLHRYVITAFASSLERYPPGSFTLQNDLAKTVVQLGTNLFVVGLRLACPVIAMMLLTDIALALLGRINSQLQIGTHAFPAKMLLTLVMLATVLAVVPSLYQAFSSEVLRTIRASFGR